MQTVGATRPGVPGVPDGRARRGRRGRGALRLSPRLRKLVLTVHVIVSVGWLGLDLGLLAFGITGLTTGDPETRRAVYLAADLAVGVAVIPISLATLVSGVVLSIGTRWGLFRYWWVVVKLVLTTGATIATAFALRSSVGEAAAAVRAPGDAAATGVGDVAASLVAAPTVALVIYTTATVLSVFKPWGPTPYGRRQARERRGNRL